MWVRSGVDDAGRGHERKGEEVAVMAPQEQGNVVPPLSPSYFPAMALDETGANVRDHEDDQPEQRSQHLRSSSQSPGLKASAGSFPAAHAYWGPTFRANYQESSPVRMGLH